MPTKVRLYSILGGIISIWALPASAAHVCLTNADLPVGATTIPSGFKVHGVAVYDFQRRPLDIVDLGERVIGVSGAVFAVEDFAINQPKYVQVRWIRPDIPHGFEHVFTLKYGLRDKPYDQQFTNDLPNRPEVVTLRVDNTFAVWLSAQATFLVRSVCFADKKSDFPTFP